MDYIRSSSYHFSKNKKNIQFFDAPDKFTNDFKKLGGRYYSKTGMWTFPAYILHKVGNGEESAMEEEEEEDEEQVDVNGEETDTSAMEEEQVDVNGEESAMEEEADEEVENGEESAMEEEEVEEEAEEEVENGEESAMEEEEVENGEESAMEEEEEEIIEQITVDAMEEEEEEEIIEQITVDAMEEEEEEEEVIEQITVDAMEEEEQVEAEESNTYLSEECIIVEPNEHTDYHNVITIDHNDRMQEAATTHAIDIEEEVIELDGDIEDDEEDSVLELENLDYYNIESNLEHKANQSKDHYVIDIINDEYEYDANSQKVAQTPTIHERDRISKEDALYINETLVRSTNKYKIYPSDQFYDIIANYKKLVQLKEK